ncbi:MAG TPA: hypothetical protein PKN48_02535 [Bacteroidales bacterium]|nr:hypothetical protein [Bacteroidales bacterium]
MIILNTGDNFKKEAIPDMNDQLMVELNNEIDSLSEGLEKNGLMHILSDFFDDRRNSEENIRTVKDIFIKFGECNSLAAKDSKSKTEYMGIYIFSEKVGNDIKPVYVGISRKIIRRLKNHAYGPTKDTATLAYLLAFGDKTDLKSRHKFNDNIDKIADISRLNVRNLFVYIHLYNDCHYKLQLLEVLAACKFKTKWNSFKTH